VVLHPLVLLSVVDHYNRVARDTKKRVVGVLLGSTSKGVVDVSNSFAGWHITDIHQWPWAPCSSRRLMVPSAPLACSAL
jgi:hypothetical protein